MTSRYLTIRASFAVLLCVCASLASAQQPVVTEPLPSFDPYGNVQPDVVIPGAIAPPPSEIIVQETLPVYPAAIPVRFVWFGEFLYLRASDAATTNYAVPVNGGVVPPPTPAVPMGPLAFTEHSWKPGFRAGFEWVWNDYSRWVVTYTDLKLKSSDSISVDPASTLALQSLVLHPSTLAADDYYLTAGANGRVKMRLGDLEYRRVFVDDWYRWDFLVGGRYAGLDQTFRSVFTNATTTETVDANVDFEGGGIRFGTRGDWRSCNHGWFIYAQATTSFIAGQFRSRYTQTDSFLGTVANTSRKDDRIINLTDIELGLGWHSKSRRWWFSTGYMFNTWSDMVNSAGVIRTAQATSFTPIRERLTFDGLTARGELRF